MDCNAANDRFSCHHPGCERSYLRVEHLNRHCLTHKPRAFACYFCKRQFTRNDLLQVHLRRHEDRAMDLTPRRRTASPPHRGHRDELLKSSCPTWDGKSLPTNGLAGHIMDPPGGIDPEMTFPVRNESLTARNIRLEEMKSDVRRLIQLVEDRFKDDCTVIGQEARHIIYRISENEALNSDFAV